MNEISESMENYLRCIYELSYANKGVRLTDLALKMRVKKASANNAVMKLSKAGYAQQIKYGCIFLTDAGINAVKGMTGKHIMIEKFLRDVLGVDAATADIEASKIEHSLSSGTVYAMHQLTRKYKKEI